MGGRAVLGQVEVGDTAVEVTVASCLKHMGGRVVLDEGNHSLDLVFKKYLSNLNIMNIY